MTSPVLYTFILKEAATINVGTKTQEKYASPLQNAQKQPAGSTRKATSSQLPPPHWTQGIPGLKVAMG